MSKYTAEEQAQIKNIVAMLSIKRIPDPEIMKAVFDQTNKTIARKTLYNVRQSDQEGIIPLV